MSTQTLESIEHRVSANAFDTSKPLSKAEIEELVRYALEAPSSFDLQHARFIAVVDPAQKEKLKALSMNQQKVADAAVTFIVLGDMLAHEKLPDLVGRAVKAGVFEQGTADYLVKAAAGFYGDYQNERLVRDEAIRSASFAAMTLMLAADAKGLVSGPMIGFDAAGVQKAFDIPARYVPVMTLAVGHARPGNWPRKPRLTVAEALAYDEGRTF